MYKNYINHLKYFTYEISEIQINLKNCNLSNIFYKIK